MQVGWKLEITRKFAQLASRFKWVSDLGRWGWKAEGGMLPRRMGEEVVSYMEVSEVNGPVEESTLYTATLPFSSRNPFRRGIAFTQDSCMVSLLILLQQRRYRSIARGTSS